MQELLKKLNWKQNDTLVLLQAPSDFRSILRNGKHLPIVEDLSRVEKSDFSSFL